MFFSLRQFTVDAETEINFFEIRYKQKIKFLFCVDVFVGGFVAVCTYFVMSYKSYWKMGHETEHWLLIRMKINED